ncbi:MAG: IS5 family transposase [Synergistaceae bacterium]|nr:IS5 family transposase [Synergistaceae bacterium]
MRRAYDSDITREQFVPISQDLENAKKTTRPRKADLYDIFCAILYLLKNACTWRNIPHDFPNWRIVRCYYEIWTAKDENGQSLLDYVQAKLVDIERYTAGRKPLPSILIVDSKTIQNADCAEKKGYDAGKKKTGVKIHIGADILGLPYASLVTTASVTDRNGAIEMFSEPTSCLPTLKAILCDGGYSGENFADKIHELTGARVEIAKRSELHKFAVIPKRWVVERTFGWLDKCRRLWKNCERKIENTLNMFKLAFISLLLKRY